MKEVRCSWECKLLWHCVNFVEIVVCCTEDEVCDRDESVSCYGIVLTVLYGVCSVVVVFFGSIISSVFMVFKSFVVKV